jgi:hypothetical protein
MRHDLKIRRLIQRFGLEGYGLYNLILESITESLTTESPLPNLAENCEDIAILYNGNTSKINEMMNFMINQGLFEISEVEGQVLCGKLYKFLDSAQTRSEKIRAMIKSYKKAVNLLPERTSDMSETVCDSLDLSVQNLKEPEPEEEIEKRTIKEKKQEKKEIPFQPFEPYNPEQGESEKRDFTAEFEIIRASWNDSTGKAEKKTLFQFSNSGKIMDLMNPYTLDEILQAIQNYGKTEDSKRLNYSIPGFLETGVPNYLNAHPVDSEPVEIINVFDRSSKNKGGK